jgi:hypothetical protein
MDAVLYIEFKGVLKDVGAEVVVFIDIEEFILSVTEY